MDLKRTKVTVPKNIDWRSPGTVPRLCIESHFSAFASSLKLDRGLFCEWCAALFLERHGHELLAHRYRTPYGEADLILRTPEKNLKIVEVKSFGADAFLSQRVSWRQKRRLQRVLEYFSGFTPLVELELALVDHRNKVQILENVWS